MHHFSFFMTTNSYQHAWLLNKRLGTPNVRLSRVRFYKFHNAGSWTTKGAPWLKDFNRIYGRMRDMGFPYKFRDELLPLRATLVTTIACN